MSRAQNAVATTAPAGNHRSLIGTFGQRYSVEPAKVLGVLKQTCFRTEKPASDEQMMALLVVANEYRLNPFTKEIFAFEDKHRGIVPVVSVDGWTRIINAHPQLQSIEFEYDVDGEWVDCIIERKDRTKPTRIREYLVECRRNTGPWQSHPQRMLRHKALIQCARVAFGFGGIYDQDEAERFVEVDVTPRAEPAMKPKTAPPRARSEAQSATEAEIVPPASGEIDPAELEAMRAADAAIAERESQG